MLRRLTFVNIASLPAAAVELVTQSVKSVEVLGSNVLCVVSVVTVVEVDVPEIEIVETYFDVNTLVEMIVTVAVLRV